MMSISLRRIMMNISIALWLRRILTNIYQRHNVTTISLHRIMMSISLRRIMMNISISLCLRRILTNISQCRILTHVSHRHNVTIISLLLWISLEKI